MYQQLIPCKNRAKRLKVYIKLPFIIWGVDKFDFKLLRGGCDSVTQIKTE